MSANDGALGKFRGSIGLSAPLWYPPEGNEPHRKQLPEISGWIPAWVRNRNCPTCIYGRRSAPVQAPEINNV